MDAVGFEQADAAQDLPVLLLDRADQGLQRLRQRRAVGDHLEHVALPSDQGLGALALGLLDGKSGEIGDCDREQALVRSPLDRRPHVLVAEHALEPAVEMDRHVQHRADAELRQIVGGELARERMVVRIVGHDGLFRSQPAKVVRVVLDAQDPAARMEVAAVLVQVLAADGGAVLGDAPQAGAFDAHLLRPRCG